MRFIVPAKTGSTRIENKNWREFSGGKSLVQLCVDKLLPLGEVVVTCEDESKADIVAGWGCDFHHRPVEWCGNDYPLTDWIRNTCEEIAPDETVGWCQVTSPMFDEYENCLYDWEKRQECLSYDSLVVVYEKKGFWLGPDHRPIGWGFGEWHTKGQLLPRFYQMPWVFSILTPESIRRTGYHIGANPYWYPVPGSVDIDTEDDWDYAKYLWEDK